MTLIDLRTVTDEPTPMQACLNVWHEFLHGDRSALDRMLADDVVLHSPVLFRPVHGKELVTMYLVGASMTFVGDAPSGAAADPAPVSTADPTAEWDGRFRYIRTVVGDHDAVLEFETTMGGKYVNGVDMVKVDDAGKIIDFKVMVRPRQALETVQAMMGAALEKLQNH